MSNLRQLAHLEEQLGDERFQALISSDNTGKVRDFCDELVKNALPAKITVGGRTYDILGFMRRGEGPVEGDTLVDRSKEINANLGQEEGEHLLECQDEIPVELRGKVAFLFTDWRHPSDSRRIAYIFWSVDLWYKAWYRLDDDWSGGCRFLRRK